MRARATCEHECSSGSSPTRLSECGEEAEWLRQFVEDIPRWPKPVTAISIHCDSKPAMGRAKSTMYNGKSRHIRRLHNSIRQLLSTGVISIDYVASNDNIADPFIKDLSREGYAMNGMFNLNVVVVKNEINKINSSAYLIESSNVWHARLGHVNFNSTRRLIKFNSIPNCHIDSKYKCETCVEAKLTRTSFKSVKQKTKPLDMVHTDICDLKSLPTKGGNKYFITFIDDCSKYCYAYLLKSKDESIDKFALYKTEVENQLGMKIKQNGIAERKNRTLKEMVTAMLISFGLSQDIWVEAILTAIYLLNKLPRKDKEETPYELWMRRKPSYQYLRVWGCLAKNTIMESRNASFFEHIFPCLSKETGSSSRFDDEVVQDKRQRDDNDLQDERQDQTEEEVVELRRSKRERNEKSFGPDFASFMVENEPTSYREAITSSEGQQ
nr:Pol polyprotein [Tanacetum cinerariifolium]